MIWIWNGAESTSGYFLLFRLFFYLLRNLLSWRWVALYMTNSYQVSQCNWSRTTGGRYCRRGSVNLNCQIEEDFVEELKNGREKRGVGSLKRTHFQGPGILDSDRSFCSLFLCHDIWYLMRYWNSYHFTSTNDHVHGQ